LVFSYTATGGCTVKTLGQIENDIRQLTSTFRNMGKASTIADLNSSIEKASEIQSELWASLSTIHALAEMQAQALREELTALVALRDGETEVERVEASKNLPRGYGLCSWLYQEGSNPLVALDARILTSGLARIEHLRGLLGEEEEG
jgi:hypothetical protein